MDDRGTRDGMASHLSEYERKRLQNIERNKVILRKLGLVSKRRRTARAKSPPSSSSRKKLKTDATPSTRRKQKKTNVVPRRKSSRLKGIKAKDYTKEKVIEDDDSSEVNAKRKAFLERKKRNTTEEVLKKSMEWLKATRKQISEQFVKSEVVPGQSSNEIYKSKSIAKWGKGVFLCHSSTSSDFDWEAYYVSRLSTPCQVKSPLLLLQEMYNDCKYRQEQQSRCPTTNIKLNLFAIQGPWKLLCACTLMSRVSSASVKEKAIKMFFDNYPTPTACLQADPAHLHKLIAPLGLFETRFRSVVEVSRKFLSLNAIFNVGLTKELKIYGIGEFGVDSFQIFCRDVVGNDSKYCPSDKNLQSYCRWRKGL